MATSNHTNLATALIAAQSQFGDVTKDKRVNVRTKEGKTYNYTYADLGSTLDAVLPALHANGLALLQPMDVRDGKPGIVTRLLHTSGETLEGWTPIIVAGQGAQEFGSGITYARRYGLTALLCIAAEDDDGAAASKPQERKPEPRKDVPGHAIVDVDPNTGEVHTVADVEALYQQAWDEAHPKKPFDEEKEKSAVMRHIMALAKDLGYTNEQVKEEMWVAYGGNTPEDAFSRTQLTLDQVSEYRERLVERKKKKGAAK